MQSNQASNRPDDLKTTAADHIGQPLVFCSAMDVFGRRGHVAEYSILNYKPIRIKNSDDFLILNSQIPNIGRKDSVLKIRIKNNRTFLILKDLLCQFFLFFSQMSLFL